jgi:hypothetical protein
MNIKADLNYMEGYWAGLKMEKHIEATVYKTLDGAIASKHSLVEHFKSEFGYSDEEEEFDRNYSYNHGILDALKFLKQKQDEK